MKCLSHSLLVQKQYSVYAFRNYMHYLDFCTHFVIKCDQFTCTASFIKWSGLH